MTAPRWIETGAGPRGLLFLHGVSGGAQGAASILPAITPPGWRGLAWDMPGYGASALIDPVDFDGYAAAVVDLLDAAGLDRAVLVGHSMGGMIALQTVAPFRIACPGWCWRAARRPSARRRGRCSRPSWPSAPARSTKARPCATSRWT